MGRAARDAHRNQQRRGGGRGPRRGPGAGDRRRRERRGPAGAERRAGRDPDRKLHLRPGGRLGARGGPAAAAGPRQAGSARGLAPRRGADNGGPGATARRRTDAGRDGELRRLRSAFERTLRERTPRIVTMLGSAGIGKSRLARELAAELGDRSGVHFGNCLPYGEGITFWPLTEMVRDIAGPEPRPAIEEVLASERRPAALAERVLQAVGLEEGIASGPDVTWAVRAYLERWPGAGLWCRLRGHPLGRAAPAGADRAPGAAVPRCASPDPVRRPRRAPRAAAGLAGRRPPRRDARAGPPAAGQPSRP